MRAPWLILLSATLGLSQASCGSCAASCGGSGVRLERPLLVDASDEVAFEICYGGDCFADAVAPHPGEACASREIRRNVTANVCSRQVDEQTIEFRPGLDGKGSAFRTGEQFVFRVMDLDSGRELHSTGVDLTFQRSSKCGQTCKRSVVTPI